MLILESGEPGAVIPRSDRRVAHILKILKKGRGDELLAGIADGPAGTARIESSDASGMSFSFRPTGQPAALHPLIVLLGFPRPIQANRILKDLASMGASRIVLSGTELGEKSYFQSDFFKNREFRAALLEGAEQAANPLLPRVDTAWTLARALDLLDDDAAPGGGARWALDPYRASLRLGEAALLPSSAGGLGGAASAVLAIGSERGWTPAELDLLQVRGFSFASLGGRILRSETACTAAAAIALAAMGRL